MKKLIFAFLLLSGCVSSPEFTPQTRAGAECKNKCAMANQACEGTAPMCSIKLNDCYKSCQDIERLGDAK